MKNLSTSIIRQHADMAWLNSALADTTAEKARLEDDVFNLQGQIEQVTEVGSCLSRHRNLVLASIQAKGSWPRDKTANDARGGYRGHQDAAVRGHACGVWLCQYSLVSACMYCC